MIHLRKFSTTWSKSMLKSYKSPLSRSKLLGVLLKPECLSSVSQAIRFLSVEERPIVPSTKTEDDTNKDVSKTLAKFSVPAENLDKDTSIGRVGGGNVTEDDNRIEMKAGMSIEVLRKFIKEADTLKTGDAMRVIHRFCGLFGSKYFPVFSICRFKNSDSLISPNEFEEVFETVERNLRFLKSKSLVKTLEACAILKISDSSSLMQKLIKLLSSNINSMSSLEVVHIYCIIEGYYSKDNPQIAALRTACHEFFKYYFEDRTHPKSEPEKMARYVCYDGLPVNVRECFIRKIFESKSSLPFWSYSNILRGLVLPGVFEYDKFHKDCVHYVLEEVQRIMGNPCPILDLFYFLKNYRLGVLSRRIPYDQSFLDKFALNIVKSSPPLAIGMDVCRIFFQMSHFNYALFDYVASKAAEDLNSGELKLNPSNFFKLTKILSGAGKQTKIINPFFREKLKAACLFLPKYETDFKVQLPLSLAVLGIYEDNLIEHCFTSENGGLLTEEDIKGFNDFSRNMLLLLHQAVVAFHPSYQEPLLSEDLMMKLSASHYVVSQTHNIWQEVVESCFGGPNFVMKNCTTPLHHNLSYVVVLDKNNVPIDVASIQGTDTRATDQPFNIADIATSEETQVIVIQDIFTEGHVTFRNVSCWKGHFQLYIDILEVYCNGVVPLRISEFKSLDSSERVPFLLSKIEKKFGVLGKRERAESEK